MSPRISIVGMGDAGTLAARRLLETEPDIALTVYDIDPERCEDFRGSATLATSAREALAESDTIVLALPREREIDRTLERFSDGEVTAPVAGKQIIDLAPPPAEQARRLGLAIANAGGRYIPARDEATEDAGARLVKVLLCPA
jgi:3-hydroxyisobutyrate dehydrogenase-like beta-hydroxyacid dehydrogenase